MKPANTRQIPAWLPWEAGMHALLVPTIWFVLLGWRWDLVPVSHDGLAMGLPALSKLAAAKGSWSALEYVPEWAGGSKLSAIASFTFFQRALAALGVGAFTLTTATVFFIQWLVGALGLRLSRDLALILDAPKPATLERAALFLIFAFAPIAAWRLGYGHAILIQGALAGLAALGLVASTRARTLNPGLGALATLAFLHSIPTQGQQTLVYAAIFVGPVWLAFARMGDSKDPSPWRALFPSIAFPLAGVLISLPWLWPMIEHAGSADALRGLDSKQAVTYSHLTASGADWLGSLSWAKDWAPQAGDSRPLHETNYPLGPFFFALFLLPWKKFRLLGAALLASLAGVLVFSVNLAPLSDLLLTLLPPLRLFRVPARAMIPLAYAFMALGSAAILLRANWVRVTPGVRVAGIAAALAGFFLPPFFRELFWIFLIAILAVQPRLIPREAALLVLALSSVSAFQERLQPFWNRHKVEQSPAVIAGIVHGKAPELASPLIRAASGFTLQPFDMNTMFMLRLSSIDAYWWAPRRFIELLTAIRGEKFESTIVRYQVAPDSGLPFQILGSLFNVSHLLEYKKELNTFEATKRFVTLGPAWINPSLQTHPDIASLALVLKRQVQTENRIAPATHVLESEAQDLKTSPECASGRIELISATPSPFTTTLRWNGPATPCLATIASNWVAPIRAVDADTQASLRVFPSYGTLIGVQIPAGTRTLQIAASNRTPVWVWALFAAGLSLLAGTFVWVRARCFEARHSGPSGSRKIG